MICLNSLGGLVRVHLPFERSSAAPRSLTHASKDALCSFLHELGSRSKPSRSRLGCTSFESRLPQLTAVVIKFAGNILKGFATALALISTSLISIPMLGFSPAALFWVGLVAVILSTFMCAHLLTARARRVMRTPRASNRRIPL